MVVCVGEEHVSGSECTICWAPLLYTLGVCVSVCKCEYIWLLQSRLRLVLFFCYIQRKINKYKTREYRTCNGKQKKKFQCSGRTFIIEMAYLCIHSTATSNMMLFFGLALECIYLFIWERVRVESVFVVSLYKWMMEMFFPCPKIFMLRASTDFTRRTAAYSVI